MWRVIKSSGTRNGIFISSNHGDSWDQTSYDPIHGEVYDFLVVDSLIFAGADAGENVFDKGGIFLSSDTGQSWISSDSGISATISGLHPSVYALTRIGSTIFAGTNYGVFSSIDTGKTWIWDTLGVFTTSFAVIDSTLFAGHFGASFVSRSTNMGISWTRCDSGLPSTGGIPYIAASGRSLIAGTHFYLMYFSSDMGDYWKPVNEGLDSLSDFISSVSIIDNYVFAGGSGLWRRPLAEITSVESNPILPERFDLKQNHPNPFNPSTVITYRLSTLSDVSLIVYDVLGREVQTLINERQSAGNHSVTFDASNFSSGVYFYRLNVDGHTASKKMVLIK